MTISIGQALQALQVLQKMGAASFPAKEAYCVARLISRLQIHPDLVALAQTRIASVRKFGAEKDGQIIVGPDRIAEFLAEYEPVAAQPIELDVPLLSISILENAPAMTPAEMQLLEPFFAGSTA